MILSFLGVFGRGGKILELTSHNFENIINANPYILVNFYSPFCKYCIRFAPEFKKTAKKIFKKRKFITVAQIDAANETAIANQQGIERYPTLKFFKHSIPCRYDGPQESAKILQWMERHIAK
ncbi:protein disulfide-isomerase-like [Diorhabda carinulata]|uniref:protein disulfide-isomerase-like n=1 Tax=Diorhabda carinulata TaxID=1163345 RepID=UPI0025A1D2E6|nr:protein disulfide-isomerase-like [Diorhabda carinulata]